MVYRNIIIERGKPGTTGFAFDIEGMSVPNIASEVKVYMNFQQNSPPIGRAMIHKYNGILYANINIEATLPRGSKLWPAVAFNFDSKNVKKGIVTKSTITSLSLCTLANSDIEIQPIEI